MKLRPPHLGVFACAAAVALISGCALNGLATRSECQLPPDVSLVSLVNHLNQSSAPLHAWRAENVRIAVRGAGIPPLTSVSAKIAVAAPRNFRLVASSAFSNEVDMGSNDDRFWFWARSQRPVLLTSAHSDFDQAQRRLPIPFQPDWLIEALGVIPIDARAVAMEHTSGGAAGQRLVKLVADRVSPQGEPIRKVIVADACHGVVLEHGLYDGQGRLIARAVLSHHARVWLPGDRRRAPSGPIMPGRIDFDWPQAKVGLTLTLGPVDVNPVSLPARLWSMPALPDTPVVDLGRPSDEEG